MNCISHILEMIECQIEYLSGVPPIQFPESKKMRIECERKKERKVTHFHHIELTEITVN